MSDETFVYENYQIPIPLLHNTGSVVDTFDYISKGHLDLVRYFIGVQPSDHVVEIGCGIGCDAIPLSKIITSGSYLGIDVQKASIDWCSANITQLHPNFIFRHFDVQEPWYNPDGKLSMNECKIPADAESIDKIILQSVFTHMRPSEIAHYLGEFRRCLKPGGAVYATFFIVTDEILANQDPNGFITFWHNIEDGCYIHDAENPTMIVAYKFDAIERLAAQADLR
jgi:SAM-dependent methyltransferase